MNISLNTIGNVTENNGELLKVPVSESVNTGIRESVSESTRRCQECHQPSDDDNQ